MLKAWRTYKPYRERLARSSDPQPGRASGCRHSTSSRAPATEHHEAGVDGRRRACATVLLQGAFRRRTQAIKNGPRSTTTCGHTVEAAAPSAAPEPHAASRQGRQHTTEDVAADAQGFVREFSKPSLVIRIIDLVSGLPERGDEPADRVVTVRVQTRDEIRLATHVVEGLDLSRASSRSL